MKWKREQYIELMTFGEQRPMFTELFGPLIGLDDEWRSQGASEDEINMTAFDFDYVPVTGCGAVFGIFGAPKPVVLEDTDEYTITRDEYGRTAKLHKAVSTLPLPLDYPVKDMDSWLEIKPKFVFCEERINWDKVEEAKRAQQRGNLVNAWVEGGFDLPRQLMGEAELCVCYYDNPELMNDILNTAQDTAIKIIERLNEKITIDNLCIHEDMAGKSGSLVGPNMIKEFISPYYKALWQAASSGGTRLFSQDSDGNMNSVTDEFLEAGINIMYPAEPAAGMDIVEIRNKYPKLALKGGIDKHVMRRSKSDILDELTYKLQPCMHKGMVFALDHRITNGTPIENYRYYVNTAREMLGLPGISQKGWARMAF